MATALRHGWSLRESLYWEETDCLTFYGMLSLHELFEIVGSQLTETDIEVLSFLLDEVYPSQHPLDPASWTPDRCQTHPEGGCPNPELQNAWRRSKPSGGAPCPIAARHSPKSGLELLLALERRGHIGEGNLEPLLQLLRVLTRHDLLPLVSCKKRRAVSPERVRLNPNPGTRVLRLLTEATVEHAEQIESRERPGYQSVHFTRGADPTQDSLTPRQRKRRKRGHGWSRPSQRRSLVLSQSPPTPPAPEKMTCNVRLRVRAEYQENDAVLRGGVSSDKREPLERQFDLFSRASSLLRTRELGTVVCEIKFTDLDKLEAFWGDYLSGALLEALKGVFITDVLRMAAGREGVRLLINVDQDDYEDGRRLLMDNEEMSATCRDG